MTVPAYRLDSVAVHLIDRLEGTRPTYAGRPDEAAAVYRRIADEELSGILAEHDELIGDPTVGPVLRREVHETFLPRYGRLADAMNQLEDAGFGAWRGGDPVARAVTTLLALFVALAGVRLIHHPVALLLLGLAAVVPFLPELRRWYHRRHYARLLQEVVDDMARIQGRIEAFPAPPEQVTQVQPGERADSVVDTPEEPEEPEEPDRAADARARASRTKERPQ